MSTTQPVGLAMRFVDMQSAAATRTCPRAVQQTAGGKFPIRAAPVRHTGADSKEVKVTMRQIRGLPSGDRPQAPAIDIEGWLTPPIRHESLERLGLGGIVLRGRGSPSSLRCGPGALRF